MTNNVNKVFVQKSSCVSIIRGKLIYRHENRQHKQPRGVEFFPNCRYFLHKSTKNVVYKGYIFSYFTGYSLWCCYDSLLSRMVLYDFVLNTQLFIICVCFVIVGGEENCYWPSMEYYHKSGVKYTSANIMKEIKHQVFIYSLTK